MMWRGDRSVRGRLSSHSPSSSGFFGRVRRVRLIMGHLLVNGHYDPIKASARRFGIFFPGASLRALPCDLLLGRPDNIHWHLPILMTSCSQRRANSDRATTNNAREALALPFRSVDFDGLTLRPTAIASSHRTRSGVRWFDWRQRSFTDDANGYSAWAACHFRRPTYEWRGACST